jgi:hypothetical protein
VQSVIQMASALLASVGQVVGIRNSIEEPHYSVETKLGDIEIRRYDDRLAAETVVEGAAEAARSAGFRRLAGYIFGGNTAKGSIAMTAPVAQASEKIHQENAQQIAMTARVAQAKDAGSRWRIQFFMPTSYTRDSLPTPSDPSVRIVAVPAQHYAVLRFSGDRGGKVIAAQEARLLAALQSTCWRPIGSPVAWFYDPPWTIPALRRNEVAAPVAKAR